MKIPLCTLIRYAPETIKMQGSGHPVASGVTVLSPRAQTVVFLPMPSHRKFMNMPQKFCTACGAPLVSGMRFCTRCGQAVTGPGTFTPAARQPPRDPQPAGPVPAAPPGGERILGIVPFIEQGLLSVIHSTLIVTDRRLIFCTWDPGTDEMMSDADDAVMQESCDISEITDEIAHFRAKDWSEGPWQQYAAIAPDAVIAGAPGTIVIPLPDIVSADIVCETRTSTQDKLYLHDSHQAREFDLMYSQGQYLFRILQPLLGENVTIADHLHRRSKFDRLLSGQEYK